MSGTRRIPVVPMESREAPPALLASLRDIDPSVELIYFGSGRWLLGAVRKSDTRERQGRALLQFERSRDVPNPRNVLMAHLIVHGFAPITEYHCDGCPSSESVFSGPATDPRRYAIPSIVEDFRARDFCYRHDEGEVVFQQRLSETKGGPQQQRGRQQLREYLITDGREHYRREVRDRKQFGAAGMTGGTGSGLAMTSRREYE